MMIRCVSTALLIGLSANTAATEPNLAKLPPELGSASFVITASGELYAWGRNYYGQLGIGTEQPTEVPVRVERPPGVRAWKDVAGGDSSSGIDTNGELYRWGRTDQGSSAAQLTPLLVAKPSGVNYWVDVAGNHADPIALADDGNLYRWSRALNAPPGPHIVPKPEGVNYWLKATTSRSYYLAIADDGELYEWENMNPPSIVPRPEGVAHWRDVSSGMFVQMALADNGEIYQGNPLWNGPIGLVARPQGVDHWKKISAGYLTAAAIGSDDRLYVWEDNLGPGQVVPFPEGVRQWIALSAGYGAVYMIGDDCRLYSLISGVLRIVPNLEELCRLAAQETSPGMVSLAPFHPVFQRESEFRLHVLGNIADPFVLLRSRDLKTWTPISTNAPVAGWEVLSDSTAESADAYFYRVADEQSLNAVR